MIQVCSQCGTRWNVRDKRRMWCPRCSAALLAPMPGPPGPAAPTVAAFGPPAPQAPAPGVASVGPAPPGSPWGPEQQRPAAPLLPRGYRWIAVRPGPPPPIRRPRRQLGPTPRYTVIPRWGLVDPVITPTAAPATASAHTGPSAQSVRALLTVATAVLGFAALVYLGWYGLLMYNRTTLLPDLVGGLAVWAGRVASVLAVLAVIAATAVLAGWLVARRSAAFAHDHRPETRRRAVLWLGCLLPLANLFWAPVYVIELAGVEGQYARLRKPILRWWALWVLSTGLAVYATATRWASDAQGIANNVMAFVLAYLAAGVAVAAATRVVRGFDARPVERPAHRWVVVAGDDATPPQPVADPEPAALESQGQEPAA